MKPCKEELERWLEQIALVIYRRYTGGVTHDFHLRIVRPPALGAAFGRFYPHSGRIEISEEVVLNALRGETCWPPAPVLCKKRHELSVCGCRDGGVCRAWVRLLDTLMHELVHLYCFNKHKCCKKHGCWNKFLRGHCVHFLWYAIRMELDLAGVFELPKTKLLHDKIRQCLNPPLLHVWGKVTSGPGRIKSLLTPPGGGPAPASAPPRGESPEPPLTPAEFDFDDLHLYGVGACG